MLALLGTHRQCQFPDDCPFCGAPKRYLKTVQDFTQIWKTELDEQEKKDIYLNFENAELANGQKKAVSERHKNLVRIWLPLRLESS